MDTAAFLANGRSQAVCLPEGCRLEGSTRVRFTAVSIFPLTLSEQAL